MKIAILGASVSAQTITHNTGEVTGYAEVMRREHTGALGACVIKQFTYPGNRLSDGGLLRLEEVLNWGADICLIEPLIEDGRRGKNSLEVEKRHIYISLLEAGILPVTVLIPEPFGRSARNLPHYDQFIGISRQYGLPVIEVDVADVSDIEEKFSGVHTRLEGARIYARQIVDALLRLENPMQRATDALAEALKRGRPQLSIAPIPLLTDMPSQVKYLEITIVSRHPERLPIRLVQHQDIGKFSPVLDVVLSRHDQGQICSETISIWDEYCHYNRSSYVMLADAVLEEPGCYTLSLGVSSDHPAYSKCRHPVEEWPKHRYMVPKGPPVLISKLPVETSGVFGT